MGRRLFSERRRLRDMEEREAAGESFWTSALSPRLRVRTAHALGALRSAGQDHFCGEVPEIARSLVLQDVGATTLTGTSSDALRDFYAALENEPTEMVLTMLEAVYDAVPLALSSGGFVTGDARRYQHQYEQDINECFLRERTSYEMVNGEIVPFDSREMHVEVVVPTLTLLARRSGWGAVEDAYQNALREISEGHPADAITDAGTALQEALKLSGASGNALGPLASDARKRGILAPHDSTLAVGIEKIVHWVSADRSEAGDAHKAGTDDRADAWFAVHVVGALILRLAEGGGRG